MANPGYGKRSAPDQLPPRSGDFDHRPAREAYLAGLIDRLCENAAMDAKTLAKSQPLYGQQAVRSALNELGRTGHLRRVRRRVVPADGSATGTRWVFRTYWSRTARDDEWWARLLEDDASGATPGLPPEEAPPASVPAAPSSDVTLPPEPSYLRGGHGNPQPSLAYAALAGLGLREPRLALSSAACAALEQLAADWLARGTPPEQLTQVLVTGLPEQGYSSRGLVRRRLIDKMPPARLAAEARAPRAGPYGVHGLRRPRPSASPARRPLPSLPWW